MSCPSACWSPAGARISQAILEACARPGFPAQVAVVISDRERAAGAGARAGAGVEAL